MTLKRSLPIVLLTLALAMGSVAIAYAPVTSQTTITTPVISPTSPTASDIVTIATNVTSSMIKNVTITYTTDNWKSSNITIVATYNSTTTVAKGQIPALAASIHVEYLSWHSTLSPTGW